MAYFKVKYGYGKDEFYSINESELSKALRAQGNGSVAVFEEGTLSGNSIMAIMPDFNRYLGYNRDYVLTGEDYKEIPRTVQREHLMAIEGAKDVISGKLTGRRDVRQLHD